MTPAGRRPKGPRKDLGNPRHQELLDRLYMLNNPRRVTYEMVGRELVPGAENVGRLRTLTRDLSRQFRGDKPIEAHVVEVYLRLLLADAPMRLQAETQACLALHAFAFPTEPPGGYTSPGAAGEKSKADGPGQADKAGATDSCHEGPGSGKPVVDAGPPVDREQAGAMAAHIADLEHQLAEAQTRASLASALLVIARAEITRLRGKRGGFDWFRRIAPAPAAPRADGQATMPLRLLPYRGRPRLVTTNPVAATALPKQRGA